jgi:hypothetical protein
MENNLCRRNAVASHLAHGDKLGNCSPQLDEKSLLPMWLFSKSIYEYSKYNY